jgi:hypothetical protein
MPFVENNKISISNMRKFMCNLQAADHSLVILTYTFHIPSFSLAWKKLPLHEGMCDCDLQIIGAGFPTRAKKARATSSIPLGAITVATLYNHFHALSAACAQHLLVLFECNHVEKYIPDYQGHHECIWHDGVSIFLWIGDSVNAAIPITMCLCGGIVMWTHGPE